MATVVGLSEGQIAQLLTDLEQIEGGLKAMYDELAELPVPQETLSRFTHIHNRYSSAINFLLRQRELRGKEWPAVERE